jgi:hypothetical protein
MKFLRAPRRITATHSGQSIKCKKTSMAGVQCLLSWIQLEIPSLYTWVRIPRQALDAVSALFFGFLVSQLLHCCAALQRYTELKRQVLWQQHHHLAWLDPVAAAALYRHTECTTECRLIDTIPQPNSTIPRCELTFGETLPTS